MRTTLVPAALVLAALCPASAVALDGPITRLATTGGKADVLARADGSAIAVWEEKPTAATSNVHVCRIAAGAGTCTAGSEIVLTGAPGTTTSKPFLFDISAGRVIVVHGGTSPQHTYRWTSADGAATFGAAVDFASIVPFDQGAAVGPGDAVSIVGDPAAGTVGYQLAGAITNTKTTAESVLDTATGLTFAQTVGLDPANNRPVALWASSTDAFFSSSTTGNLNLTASWTLPAGKVAGVTGMRLAGPFAVWLRDGRHEVARWSAGSFGAGVTLPGEPANSGEADIARDASGGVHVVYSPGTTGDVCYAYAADGTSFGIAQLLGRDPGGVAGLQVSATGKQKGRVVFSTSTPAGPVSTVPLSAPALLPNTCASPPSGLALVTTLAPTTLRAAVDPAGQDATMHIEFGQTTAYGASTPDVAVPASGGPVVQAVDLGALAPATTYHARLVAANPSGTVTSPDVTFTTPLVLAALRPRDVIRLPATCRHRRLTITFKPKAGVQPVRAVLRGTGRPGPLRLGAGSIAKGKTVVRGLARRGVLVRVALRLADGRILRTSRRYRTCSG